MIASLFSWRYESYMM